MRRDSADFFTACEQHMPALPRFRRIVPLRKNEGEIGGDVRKRPVELHANDLVVGSGGHEAGERRRNPGSNSALTEDLLKPLCKRAIVGEKTQHAVPKPIGRNKRQLAQPPPVIFRIQAAVAPERH